MVGKTLGHYEILEPLGAGGMGEVYRARDTNLDRDVAIKVLPEDFAEDAERLARFEREAKLLASLNHSNIATIHGLEDSDGVRFIAMELVEGETLAGRLAASGPIEVEEALQIAGQIAEALEAAHDSGVIHRDLKPANVKVTPGGKVKVLDFGLAKAWAPEPSEIDLTRSPTITVEGTRTGVILGTAAYMSPEQAKGKSLDKRTDIFSFGCVLYEMLTGRKAFAGEEVSETLAAILRDEPDWDELPAATPFTTRALLRRCLRKDPDRRLHDVADARIEIEDALAAGVGADGFSGADASGIDALAYRGIWAPRNRRVLVAAAVGVLVVGLALGAVLVGLLSEPGGPVETEARRMSITLGPDLTLGIHSISVGPLSISPDGSTIVFEAINETGRQLYQRRLDEWESRPIPGTEEEGRVPFFSPDGQWIGYSKFGKLWKVPLSGGAPIEVSGMTALFGATWAPDGTILFQPEFSGLYRVSADGGEPHQVTQRDTDMGEQEHAYPSMLPDGRSVLLTVVKAGYTDSDIAVLSLETGEYTVVQQGGGHPAYVPTGHLVYAREGQLLAVRFDPETLQTVGTPVPVIEDAFHSQGNPVFSISRNGRVLAYVRRDPWLNRARLVWLNRDGDRTPIEGPSLPPATNGYALSRDGQRLAFAAEGEIWSYDLKGGVLIKLTRDRAWDAFPVWTDNDERIAFVSSRSGSENLWWRRADGMGEAEELLPADPAGRFPRSSSEATLAYEDGDGRMWLLPVEGERTPELLETTHTGMPLPQISPDGRLVAYQSGEHGTPFQVYVEPIPQTGDKIMVSQSGGFFYTRHGPSAPSPMWSEDGTRLFFYERSNARKLMVARIDTEPRLDAGAPESFFEAPEDVLVLPVETNQGVLGIEIDPPPRITQIEVVLNFSEELKRLVPVDQ